MALGPRGGARGRLGVGVELDDGWAERGRRLTRGWVTRRLDDGLGREGGGGGKEGGGAAIWGKV